MARQGKQIEIDDQVDDLYGLPREQFTRARNDLARSLRRAGDAESAEQAKSLAKPDQVAWAINQASREDPGLRDGLLAAGDRLRKAQSAALGGEGKGLREAIRSEREAVDALMEVVADHLGRGHLDDAASTLHAASTSDTVRDQLRQGRLTKKARPTGMAGVDAVVAEPARRSGKKSGVQLERARASARKKRDSQRAAESDAREATEAAERTRRELDRLEKRARSTKAKAERARQAADAAAARVRKLEE